MNGIISIIWIILVVFWVIIGKGAKQRRDQMRRDNHMKNGNEINHTFSHYDKLEKQQKSNRKDFKDSGIISKDEYDVRDL